VRQILYDEVQIDGAFGAAADKTAAQAQPSLLSGGPADDLLQNSPHGEPDILP